MQSRSMAILHPSSRPRSTCLTCTPEVERFSIVPYTLTSMDFLLPGTFVAAGAAILVYRRMCAAPDKSPVPQAYILTNKVAHARLLPSESAHRFTYQTLSLLVSLNALEKHELDLGYGLLFKYGSLFTTVSGLRSSAYLGRDSKATIKEKLGAVLSARGFDPSKMSDAWMQTMPSYFGFEGINPLTVYYCYTTSNELWLIVLEVRALMFLGSRMLILRLSRFIIHSVNNIYMS